MSNLQALQSKIESSLTPRSIDGRYIPYQVHKVAEEALCNEPFEGLQDLFTQAVVQNIEYCVNALARKLVHTDLERSNTILHDYSAHVQKYFKKHMKLLEREIAYEYSIADMITEFPDKIIFDKSENSVELSFMKPDVSPDQSYGITSLYGIKHLKDMKHYKDDFDVSIVTDLRVGYHEFIDFSCAGFVRSDEDTPILDHENDPDFPNKPLEHFKKVAALVFIHWNAIPSHIFTGLESLETLFIIPPLKHEYASLFFEIPQLKKLEICLSRGSGWGTGIPRNPVSSDFTTKDFFQGLENLEELSMRRIGELPSGIFKNLSNLKKLSLNFVTNSYDFPEELFKGLENLEELEIQNIGISLRGSKKSFRYLAKLRKLKLESCWIGWPEELLQEVKHVENLVFDHCKFSYISAEFVKKLSHFNLGQQ